MATLAGWQVTSKGIQITVVLVEAKRRKRGRRRRERRKRSRKSLIQDITYAITSFQYLPFRAELHFSGSPSTRLELDK